VSVLENGSQVISVTNTALTGGAPGIVAFGTTQADNWTGGSSAAPAPSPSPTTTTTTGTISSYSLTSPDNGPGAQVVRVLQPTSPAQGVAHNFLIVLPVEPGTGTSFGDPVTTLQAVDAQDQYNLTIVEPTFALDPWYADNPNDPNTQYDTFVTKDLVPWIRQNFGSTGNEKIWLMGFSKSGLGAQDLILRHPDVFSLAASWDFPADMASYSDFSDSAACYGTDANFQANYRLTSAFVAAHASPFLSSNRIWIGGYSIYPTGVSDYDSLLTSAGIRHSTENPAQDMAHRWDSGWVPIALAALYQDSTSTP